ncbi:MAG: SEC-C domain-containing protein [Deltaproteobacteria bacterium]|nr:SEC-C domain-containing protein [Deltaproteobacteria bacterium]
MFFKTLYKQLFKTKATKIFEKYNPVSQVVNCPKELSKLVSELNTYAKAAVNLYGVILIEELANIFNSQNSYQTKSDEIFVFLLPMVFTDSPSYCFYKDYIVNYSFIDDFSIVKSIINLQKDKPRYLPEKRLFLKFADQQYEDKIQSRYWRKVLDFINKTWSYSPNCLNAYKEMKDYIINNNGVIKIGELGRNNDLDFANSTVIKDLCSLLDEAKRNTRLIETKGYTLEELNTFKKEFISNKANDQHFIVQEYHKVGLNDLCPCGSGKKYKKCCLLTLDAKTAQLSPSDCKLFYETWYGLLSFINDKMKIIRKKIYPVYPNQVTDEEMIPIRFQLWDRPRLMDEYLAVAKIPPEKIKLIKSWRSHFKHEQYILLEYLPDCAVMVYGQKGQLTKYAVKGLSRPISDTIQQELPLLVDAVLLPFKNTIIYDGFFAILPVSYDDGNLYKKVKRLHLELKQFELTTRLY